MKSGLDVSVKKATEITARKRKKSAIEVPEISNKKDKCLKKRKKTQAAEEKTTTKKKKEKQEIAEPPPQPRVTPVGKEGEDDEELSPEERRMLDRKLKKLRKKDEKAALKADGKTVVKPTKPLASQQALDYLTCWDSNRKEWRFQKTRQTWLLQHMFDSEKMPDESFTVLLLYLEGLRGAARDTTVQKAEALVKGLGDGPWNKDEQQKMQRAREVIQLLP